MKNFTIILLLFSALQLRGQIQTSWEQKVDITFWPRDTRIVPTEDAQGIYLADSRTDRIDPLGFMKKDMSSSGGPQLLYSFRAPEYLLEISFGDAQFVATVSANDGTSEKYNFKDVYPDQKHRRFLCLQKSDNTFVMFGHQFIREFTILTDPTLRMQVNWKSPNPYGSCINAWQDRGEDWMVLSRFDGADSTSLSKWNSAGQLVWTQAYEGFWNDAKPKRDGKFLICGSKNGQGAILQTDKDGNALSTVLSPVDSFYHGMVGLPTNDWMLLSEGGDRQTTLIKINNDSEEIERKLLGQDFLRPAQLYIDKDNYCWLLTLHMLARFHPNDLTFNNRLDRKDIDAITSNEWYLKADSRASVFLDNLGSYSPGKQSFMVPILTGLAGFIHANEFATANSSFVRPAPPHSVLFPKDVYIQHTFYLNHAKIEYFLEDMADGQMDKMQAYDILYWPAKGNPNWLKYTPSVNIDFDLAPFVDSDGDGVYDPKNGDYPLLKGDEMQFYLNCSLLENNSNFQVDKTHCIYVYNKAPGHPLYDAVFYQNTFFNRFYDTLSDVTSQFIGCSTINEFQKFGIIPEENIVYYYDVSDSLKANLGPPRTESFTLLDHDYASFGYTISTQPYYNFTSLYLNETYRTFLNGFWPDGEPFSYGGIGYNPGSTDTIKFIFPGDPSDPSEWSMCSIGDQDSIFHHYFPRGAIKHPNLLKGAAVTSNYAAMRHLDATENCVRRDDIKDDIVRMRSQMQDCASRVNFDILRQDTLVAYNFPFSVFAAADATATVQWSNGGTLPMTKVAEGGFLDVTLTWPDGCSVSDRVFVQDRSIPSIAPIIDHNVLSIYPNPSRDKIYIQNLDYEAKPLAYHILDTQGRLLETGVQLGSGIAVDHLLPGMYLLRVVYLDGSVSAGKFAVH